MSARPPKATVTPPTKEVERETSSDSSSEEDKPNVTASTSSSSDKSSTQHRTKPYNVITPPGAAENTWDIPRFKELEKRRLSLCQQRVRLERQLFESSQNNQPIASCASSQQLSLTEDSNLNPQQQPQRSWNNDPAFQSVEEESVDNENGYEACQHVERFLIRFERGHAHWTGPIEEVALHEDGSTISSLSSCEHPTDSYQNSKKTQRTMKPNGRGRMEYANGQVYEGNVLNGLRHGFGKNRWPDGQEYVGAWVHNSRTGRGSHSWPDGKTVTGQWTGGHLHGRCFFQWPDGATYDGDTQNGKKHGRGVHTWADGKIYKGDYDRGFEHGHGTLTEADGLCRYRGTFRLGQRHGTGTQIWRNKTYDGEWQYNAVSGRGKLSWKNGAVYTGLFAQGRYHGLGSFVDKTGRKYVGAWTHGQKEGSGRETWPQTGQVYVGGYQEGRRHGFGRLTDGDGSIYCGGWLRGKRSGRGISLNQAGSTVHCGLWKNDKPIQNSIMMMSPGSTKTSEDSQARSREGCSVRISCDDPSSSLSRSSGSCSSSRDDLDLLVPSPGQRRPKWLHIRNPSRGPLYHQDAEFFFHLEAESETVQTLDDSPPTPAIKNAWEH